MDDKEGTGSGKLIDGRLMERPTAKNFIWKGDS